MRRSSHSLSKDPAPAQKPNSFLEPVCDVENSLKEKWDPEGRGSRVLGSPGAYQQVDYLPRTGSPGCSPSTDAACSVLLFWQPGRATWVAVAAALRRGRGFLLVVAVESSLPPAAS